ncbi:MAG: hypothetical protein WCB68_21320 [Pyrinomonadaceae bacterium]
MNSKVFKTLLVITVITVLLYLPQKSFGCGPFSLGAIFTYTKHPDIPLEAYAQGSVGIIQPSYARSYLFAAYRSLNGESFTTDEQKALVDLWKERLDYEWPGTESGGSAEWLEARKKVSGIDAPPKIEVYRKTKPDDYDTYLNCQDDAFAVAASTLNERIKKFGAEAADIKDWVAAQDTVFANCSEGQHIPSDARSDADPLIRADRAYQIAAANFYSANFDEAKKLFEMIASDKSSPWHTGAPYLVARTLLRKANLGPEETKKESLTAAEGQLKNVLNDKSLASTHEAAHRLLNLVSLRLHPQARLHELSHALLQKNSDENFKQTLWDYTVVFDKLTGESADNEKEPKLDDLKALRKDDDLTDWLLTFQSDDSEATEHAVERWQKTSSNAWLVASISKVGARHPQASAILAAADKIKRESKAFPSIAFHHIRLLIEMNRKDEAREKLDELLAFASANSPRSSVNLFLSQRMTVARNLDEFLRFAQRSPTALSYDEDGREIPVEFEKDDENKKYMGQTMFDVDSIRILNEKMPLSVLRDAVTTKMLPVHLRRQLALSAWTRAALLDQREIARELVPVVESLSPELKADIGAYQSADTVDARKFAAAYIILKYPGLRPYVDLGIGRTTQLAEIDSYRDNWWCDKAPLAYAQEVEKTGEEAQPETARSVAKLAAPDFLSNTQESAADREYAALIALGVAPDYLSRLAIEGANRFPNDPRAPEALHYAVRSTRYGCTDKATGRWSKAAYDLLHKRYPTSPWAKKTKYWFKDT